MQMDSRASRLKYAVAYVYNITSKKEFTERDFVNIFTLRRHWIDADYAKRLFSICVDAGLLEEKNGYYVPTFPLRGITIPLDFRVTEEDIDSYVPLEDVFTLIVDHICKTTGKNRKDVLISINMIRNDVRYIIPDIAALIYCKEIGIDCSKFYDGVEKKLGDME